MRAQNEELRYQAGRYRELYDMEYKRAERLRRLLEELGDRGNRRESALLLPAGNWGYSYYSCSIMIQIKLILYQLLWCD